MPFLGLLGRWNSKTPKISNSPHPITLEPTASQRAYRSPHSKPFQPRPQAEAETRRWLANQTSEALDSIIRVRDRATYLVSTAQRTHAASETRTWLRAPTDGNLQRILDRRDCVGVPVPFLSAPTFTSLREMVTEAGVDLGPPSPVKEEPAIPRPVTAPPAVNARPLADEVGFMPATRASSELRGGSNPWVRRVVRKPKMYVLRPPRATYPELQEQHPAPRGRSPTRRVRDVPVHQLEPPDLLLRPGHPEPPQSASEEEDGVEVGTAKTANLTHSQRVVTVSRPQPMPEEFFTWELASRATFSEDKAAGPRQQEEDDQDETKDENKEEEATTSELDDTSSMYDSDSDYSSSSSSASYDSSIWFYNDCQEEFHLQYIRKALCLPPNSPREFIERWLYCNPSVLYHVLSPRTIPNPGLAAQHEELQAEIDGGMLRIDLEHHIRSVEWVVLDMKYVDRRERVTRRGPKVRGKKIRRRNWWEIVGKKKDGEKLDEVGGDEDKAKEVPDKGKHTSWRKVPSKLRYCETVE